MAGAAYIGSAIAGAFNTGELDHNGHYVFDIPVHPSGTITGSITRNGSLNVFINGKSAAIDGSTTDENDVCCDSAGRTSHGTVIGSSRVLINGKRAAIVGSKVTTHVGDFGVAEITEGSGNVIFG